LAFGPVAIYLLLLGAVNLFRRPFLVSGTRDTAALGLAVSGLFIVGPVELFFPLAASIRFGPHVWVVWCFLIVLFALCLVLVLLSIRPRLVIYNISTDELRPVLADVATQLDAKARWAGDSLAIPALGIQLHMEGYAFMRNVALVSVGWSQSHEGWQRLEAALGPALQQLEVPRNRCGIAFLTAGFLMGIGLMVAAARGPLALAQSLFEMLRL
jgi:hypothetical protein